MKKLFNILLSLTMISSFAPNWGGLINAEESGTAAIQVGGSVLGTNKNTGDAATVYFGGQTWRVLDYNNTENKVIDMGNTNNYMSLITSDIVGTSSFNKDKNAFNEAGGTKEAYYSLIYRLSDLDETIRGYQEIKDDQAGLNFIEAGVALERTFNDNSIVGPAITSQNDKNDKYYYWAFSTAEAQKINKNLLNVNNHSFWLRTPICSLTYYDNAEKKGYYPTEAADETNNPYKLARVFGDSVITSSTNTKYGGYYPYGTAGNTEYDTDGVRFGTVIDTDKILLATSVDAKNTGDLGTFTKIGKNTTNEWKLTVKNTTSYSDIQNFTASIEGSSTVKAGEDLSISYDHTTYANDQFVSAIITDEDGNALYYGHVANPKNNGEDKGTSSITIPSELAAGNYNVLVFSETIKEGTTTDYSSSIVTLNITVEEVTPTPTPTSTPTSTPEVKKSTTKTTSGWDDGGPFTTDTCGNVFDRWGNKIYEANGCNVGGYNLVRTSVED